MTDTIEPIPAEEARILLERAIRERCGEAWREEESGWIYVTGHDYMARLMRGWSTTKFLKSQSRRVLAGW